MAEPTFEGAVCSLCQDEFDQSESVVNSGGELWHHRCFVCVQCFQPFPEGVFFEHDGRKYCEHDFQSLFAPACSGCGDFIIGRVIRAMGATWHPECFKCILCHTELADIGFVKHKGGMPLCKPCNAELKNSGKKFCAKCNLPIQGDYIIYRTEPVHPNHFSCKNCGQVLTARSREKDGELFCLRCHDRAAAICGGCRRPIEGRIIHALTKTWHPEHFVCASCEKAFDGRRHYEKKGMAFCETHYTELFGEPCFSCGRACTSDDIVHINGKHWCRSHFRCVACDTPLSTKGGAHYIEADERPYCKRCLEKFPQELRKRMKTRKEL